MPLLVGVVEVSCRFTLTIDPIRTSLASSENSLISTISPPSVVRSFAMAREKLNFPVESVTPSPVSAPAEKSVDVIAVPLKA